MLPALGFLLAGSLTACQTPPTQAAQDFVSATSALAAAESDYFDQIQAASDNAAALRSGLDYAGRKLSWKDFLDLKDKRQVDFSKVKALRMTQMSQLQNYAKQIAAITAAFSDTSITDAATTTTNDALSLGQDAGLIKVTTSQSTLIQTAVKDLGQAIIANQTAHELQSLAKQASKGIAEIVEVANADKTIFEDSGYASGLSQDQTEAGTSYLSKVYTDNSVNVADRLLVYSQYNGNNWKPVLITKGQAIADAVKKLQAANEAMQVKQLVAASLLAQQAYQLATQALSTQPAKN